MIYPFIGYRTWEHDPVAGRPQTHTICDMDFSGTKTYKFNSLGFRGEEYNPDAVKRIFFSGCSYTFGTGLNYEETAAHKFKMLFCKAAGLDPAVVNLMNFSMPGASNDYIVRTMISQCHQVKPDIAVAIFSHIDRAEHIDEKLLGQRVGTVAPWWFREVVSQELKPPSQDAEKYIEAMREASTGYYYYSTHANSLSNFMRNALLLQFYFKLYRIPFAMHWIENDQFDYLQQHFALATEAKLLDKGHFVDYSDPNRYWCDKAADDAHPGPVSNTNLANALFETYQACYVH